MTWDDPKVGERNEFDTNVEYDSSYTVERMERFMNAPRPAQRRGLDDGPPNSIIQPRNFCPTVPNAMVGGILDHWQMLPNDVKQELKESETGFYNAMERLVAWMDENR